MLTPIIDSCKFLLDNFPDAQICRDYLDSRLNKESQELFKFGYFPNVNNIVTLTSLIGEEIIKDNGFLFSKTIEDSQYPRIINFCYFEEYPLIIPFRNVYGNTIAIVARTFLSEEERKIKNIPKYKNSKFNKKEHLFGLFENKSSILEQNCVYVVEGQFDVIKSVENGFNNIVALSNSYMSAHQLSLIMRYTKNIFLLLDNDEAGEKGRKSIISKFGNFANIRNFYLPEQYKDIDEYFSKNSEFPSFIIKNE